MESERSVQESPIFVKTDQLLMWLVRCTEKFPRSQRFKMAQRIEEPAFAFQESIQAAVKLKDRQHLIQADVQLSLLKRRLRMAQEMELITLKQYEHAARQTAEVGRLLGAWLKQGG